MKDEKDWQKWLFWFSFAVAAISVYKLLDDLKKKNAAFPKIYMAMGENDSLKLAGHRFRDYLVSNKYPVDYFETPGGHDWDFWDTHILKFLDWLPLSD